MGLARRERKAALRSCVHSCQKAITLVRKRKRELPPPLGRRGMRKKRGSPSCLYFFVCVLAGLSMCAFLPFLMRKSEVDKSEKCFAFFLRVDRTTWEEIACRQTEPAQIETCMIEGTIDRPASCNGPNALAFSTIGYGPFFPLCRQTFSSHVPDVGHSSVPRLRGPLVLPGLQPHLGVPHPPHLLLAEVPLVLGRDLGAERRAAVFRVKLGLKHKRIKLYRVMTRELFSPLKSRV